MSQQQSQFEEKWSQERPHASQYSDPGFPRELNRDPREQPMGQQEYPYGPGTSYEYAGTYGQGEKLRPRPARRNHSLRNLIIGIVIVLALLMGGGIMSSYLIAPRYMGKVEVRPQPMSTFSSSYAGTQLVFHGINGQVHIHTGNTTEVQMTTRGNIEIKSNVVNGVITLQQVLSGKQMFGPRDGDIELTVPQNMPLTVDMAGGPIDIGGVTSKMNISAVDGEISIEDSTLQDGSSLKTVNGPIHFRGSLEAKGKYDFETVNGSVDIRLPVDNSANVSTNTMRGEINNHLNTTTDPNAPTVTIKTVNGSIDINNQ